MDPSSEALPAGDGRALVSAASRYVARLAQQSPVVGLDVVCDRRCSPWRRLAWVAVMIFFCYLTMSGWCSAIGGYLTYDVTVSLQTSSNSSFTFPDISFCNVSPMNRSVACRDGRTGEESSAASESDFCTSSIEFSDSELLRISERLEATMAELEVKDPQKLRTMFFERKNMIVDCQFFHSDCNVEKVWERDMKGCFTFHEPRFISQEPSLRDVSETEPENWNKRRMELVLNPQEHEYLPAVGEVGFIALIHTPGTSPTPQTDAVFAPPGYTTYIGLTLFVQTGLPEPYQKPCSRDWPRHLAFHASLGAKKYSKKDCMQTCLQLITIALCQCQSYRWPTETKAVKGNIPPVCEKNEGGRCCARNVLRGVNLDKFRWDSVFTKAKRKSAGEMESDEPNPPKDDVSGDDNKRHCLHNVTLGRNVQEICQCHRSCYDITYAKRVTYVPFATEDETDGPDMLQRNLSKVVVYFATSNFDNIRTMAKYGDIQVLGAIGSLNGMYFGLSFLMALHLFDLLITGCLHS
ncbi:FMRFamide-activated amiloride-sensitive sodium channel-like [Haemaphysalis longicornis]